MIKITDELYFLPEVEALEAYQPFSSGRTRPNLVRGVCRQTGERSEYVVKFKGSPQMFPGSSGKELLGAFIALQVDLQVAAPAIVHISADFVDTMEPGHENIAVAAKSIGFNFATGYMGLGYQEPMQGQKFPDEVLQKLMDLFAFDVFISNPDRRVGKPNFITNGQDIFVYDHEMAFSFLEVLFGGSIEPWLIPDADVYWIGNHFSYSMLKGRNINFTGFAERLGLLDDGFWLKARQLMPPEWDNGLVTSIYNYLDKIVQHRNRFALELNRILL